MKVKFLLLLFVLLFTSCSAIKQKIVISEAKDIKVLKIKHLKLSVVYHNDISDDVSDEFKLKISKLLEKKFTDMGYVVLNDSNKETLEIQLQILNIDEYDTSIATACSEIEAVIRISCKNKLISSYQAHLLSKRRYRPYLYGDFAGENLVEKLTTYINEIAPLS